MANLIITIIGIALFIVISVGGVVYLDSGIVTRKQNEELVKSGFITSIADYHKYKINNSGEYPTAVSGWNDSITKSRAPVDTVWSYASQVDGNYFCLKGEMQSEEFFDRTIKILSQNFNSLFVGDDCGVVVNDLTYPTADNIKAFTIWLDSDYISSGIGITDPDTYYLSGTLTDVSSGKEIRGNSFSVNLGEDFLMDIDLVSDGLAVSVDSIPDVTITFICKATGLAGCNSGLARRLKINSSAEFNKRNFVINVAAPGVNSQYRTLKMASRYAHDCIAADPLSNFECEDGVCDNHSSDVYLIGGSNIAHTKEAQEQLLCLSQNQTANVLNAKYKLTGDVSFIKKSSIVDWDGSGSFGDGTDSEGWKPIGNVTAFTGEFDGDNKTITNLYINKSSSQLEYAGLFGLVDSGVISNINIEDADITAESNGGYVYSGSLAGRIQNSSTVTNASSTGFITAETSGIHRAYAGGLIGSVFNSSIDGGHADNTVTTIGNGAEYAYVGGLVGIVEDDATGNSFVENSNANGNIIMNTDQGARSGGLLGFLRGTVDSSYSTGTLSSNRDVAGGLIGYVASSATTQTTVNNCYSEVNVASSSDNIGGLIGLMSGDAANRTTINNSYASGAVSGNANFGALVGSKDVNSDVNKSYALNTNTTAIGDTAFDITNYCSYTYDLGCSVNYTLADIKGGWDDAIWEDLNDDAPILEWQVAGDIASDLALGGLELWHTYEANATYSSGNANDGTLNGNAYIGGYPVAMQLDGSGDYVDGIGNFGQTNTLSIALWFKTDSASADIIFGQTIAQYPNASGSHIASLYIDSSGQLRSELWTGAVGNVATSFNVVDNVWHHAVLSGNVNTQSLYVDGVLIGSRGGDINQSWWNYSYIGTGYGTTGRGFPSNSWHSFNGSIGNAMIYSKALTLTEVVDLYTLQKPYYQTCNATDPLDSMDMESGSIYLIGGAGGDADLAKDELLCLSNNQNIAIRSAAFKLTADVVFNADEALEDWDNDGSPDGFGTAGWIPFGSSSKRFRGDFNGNGHVIENLYISNISNYGGFFGYIDQMELKDLGFKNAEVSANKYVGVVSGYARLSIISNVYAENVNVQGSSTFSGGMFGEFNDSSAASSYATGIVNSLNTQVGGFSGSAINYSDISDSYFVGTVSSAGDNVGGLLGRAATGVTISNSYATGAVSAGDDHVGGLLGRANLNVTITNCYASSAVSGDRGVGGLLGFAKGNNVIINDSYAYWTSSPSGRLDVGGLVGRSSSLSINNQSGLCEYVDESGSPSQCSVNDVYAIQGEPYRLISDGTNDYIDIGLNWTPTTKVIIEGKAVGVQDNYDKMIGAWSPYTWIGYRTTNGGEFYFGFGGSTYSSTTPYDNNEHIFIIDLPNNEASIDSDVLTLSSGMSKPNGVPMFLFSRDNNSGSPIQYFALNLKKAEIWQDGSLVRDFIPQSNRTLLDVKNNVTYGNDGSGAFGIEGNENWSSSVWDGLQSSPTPTLN